MRSLGVLLGLPLLLSLVVFCAPRSMGVRIVVLVSVDQLMRETPPRYLAQLDGGIRRIYDDGLVHARARLDHGITETGPGHSVMLSGLDPRETGIVSNTWLRAGEDGSYESVYAGSVGLAVPTLADEIAKTGGRVLSISAKDRAAMCMVGPLRSAPRDRRAVLWYEGATARFVTGAAYPGGVPAWAARECESFPERIEAFWKDGWRAEDEAFCRAVGAARDDRPGESGYMLGEQGEAARTFPHRAARPATGVVQSPFIDTLTTDLAIAGIRAMELGADEAPDLLAVSYSAHDYIGHGFGPRSRESASHVRSLDRDLARLLEELDRAAGGADHYALVFTSDHGVLPLIEGERDGSRRRHLLDGERLRRMKASIERTAAERLDYEGEVLGRDAKGELALRGTGLYLDPAFLEHLEAVPTRWPVLVAAVPRLDGFEFVDRAVAGHRLREADPVESALARSHRADRSPQLYLVTRPGDYVARFPTGTGHGTPHDYDRDVPLVLLRGRRYRGRRSDAPASPKDARALLLREIESAVTSE